MDATQSKNLVCNPSSQSNYFPTNDLSLLDNRHRHLAKTQTLSRFTCFPAYEVTYLSSDSFSKCKHNVLWLSQTIRLRTAGSGATMIEIPRDDVTNTANERVHTWHDDVTINGAEALPRVTLTNRVQNNAGCTQNRYRRLRSTPMYNYIHAPCAHVEHATNTVYETMQKQNENAFDNLFCL